MFDDNSGSVPDIRDELLQDSARRRSVPKRFQEYFGEQHQESKSSPQLVTEERSITKSFTV